MSRNGWIPAFTSQNEGMLEQKGSLSAAVILQMTKLRPKEGKWPSPNHTTIFTRAWSRSMSPHCQSQIHSTKGPWFSNQNKQANNKNTSFSKKILPPKFLFLLAFHTLPSYLSRQMPIESLWPPPQSDVGWWDSEDPEGSLGTSKEGVLGFVQDGNQKQAEKKWE